MVFPPCKGYLHTEIIDKGTRATLIPRTLSVFPIVIAADHHSKNCERLSRNLSTNNLRLG